MRAGASELMGVYPIFRLFIVCVVLTKQGAQELDLQTQSIMALFTVLDMFQALQQRRITFAQWHHQIVQFLVLRKRAWDEDLKPKHHYALHIARMLSTRLRLWNTWVLERKHKTLKKYCTIQTLCATQWERSISRDLVSQQARNLQDPEHYRSGIYLKSPTLDDGQIAERLNVMVAGPIHVSSQACNNGVTVHAGDVCCAVVDNEIVIGRCVVHLSCTNGMFSILRRMAPTNNGHVFRLTDALEGVALGAVCAPCTWTNLTDMDDGMYSVCVPGVVRHML